MTLKSLFPARPTEFTYTQTPVLERDAGILAHHRIIMGLLHDPHCDLFRILRTRLLHQLRTQHWNSVAVTSPCAGTGKTMMAANLAIAMALEGNQTVLLVDMDFRNPRLARYLGLPPTAGLTDYLSGEVSLEQILFNPGIAGLVVIPGGKGGQYPPEWGASRRLQDLIQELKTRYESRVLLFDCPALLQDDRTRLFLPQVDGVLLVVEDGRHKPDELRHTLHLLEDTHLLGLVLNKGSGDDFPGII